METFTEAREMVANPAFANQRQFRQRGLSDDMIDAPILSIVKALNRLPCCFTLQSCYGHFVYDGQPDPENLDPLPKTDRIDQVEYRIAYIALCLDDSSEGKRLMADLEKLTRIDPGNIQFCSADWFWERQVNSYALQIEPDRFKRQDTARLDFPEARQIETTRNRFYSSLKELLDTWT